MTLAETLPPRGHQAQRAYMAIKDKLLNGAFRPGDTLSIEALAAEIGVSRQPVLEAMRRLSGDGMVEIIPQVGCRVARHDSQSIGDFFFLFATVESLAARLAAERRDLVGLKRLARLSDDIEALTRPGASENDRANGYQRLNREFHGQIHAMAEAPEIVRLAASFWDRSDFHIANAGQTALFSDRLELAHDDHEEIMDALERGDGPQAEALMRDHILGFRAAILQRL